MTIKRDNKGNILIQAGIPDDQSNLSIQSNRKKISSELVGKHLDTNIDELIEEPLDIPTRITNWFGEYTELFDDIGSTEQHITLNFVNGWNLTSIYGRPAGLETIEEFMYEYFTDVDVIDWGVSYSWNWNDGLYCVKELHCDYMPLYDYYKTAFKIWIVLAEGVDSYTVDIPIIEYAFESEEVVLEEGWNWLPNFITAEEAWSYSDFIELNSWAETSGLYCQLMTTDYNNNEYFLVEGDSLERGKAYQVYMTPECLGGENSIQVNWGVIFNPESHEQLYSESNQIVDLITTPEINIINKETSITTLREVLSEIKDDVLNLKLQNTELTEHLEYLGGYVESLNMSIDDLNHQIWRNDRYITSGLTAVLADTGYGWQAMPSFMVNFTDNNSRPYVFDFEKSKDVNGEVTLDLINETVHPMGGSAESIEYNLIRNWDCNPDTFAPATSVTIENPGIYRISQKVVHGHEYVFSKWDLHKYAYDDTRRKCGSYLGLITAEDSEDNWNQNTYSYPVILSDVLTEYIIAL